MSELTMFEIENSESVLIAYYHIYYSLTSAVWHSLAAPIFMYIWEVPTRKGEFSRSVGVGYVLDMAMAMAFFVEIFLLKTFFVIQNLRFLFCCFIAKILQEIDMA